MAAEIVSCTCLDCHQELDVIYQPTWDGKSGITLFTCWNPTCLLHGFTLSAKQYDNLTAVEWEQYRAMNRQRRLVARVVAVGEV